MNSMVGPATFSTKSSEWPMKFCDIFYDAASNVDYGLAVKRNTCFAGDPGSTPGK